MQSHKTNNYIFIIIIIMCFLYQACNKSDNKTKVNKNEMQLKKEVKQIIDNKIPKQKSIEKKEQSTQKNKNEISKFKKIKKIHKKAITQFNVDLMTDNEIKEFINQLLESGRYKEIMGVLHNDSFTSCLRYKPFVYQLYSNALEKANTKLEKFYATESLSSILYVHLKTKISSNLSEAITVTENYFNNIPVNSPSDINTLKLSALSRLLDLYSLQNTPLSDMFNYINECKKIQDYDYWVDRYKYDFFETVSQYVKRKNYKLKCSDAIKKQINDFLNTKKENDKKYNDLRIFLKKQQK